MKLFLQLICILAGSYVSVTYAEDIASTTTPTESVTAAATENKADAQTNSETPTPQPESTPTPAAAPAPSSEPIAAAPAPSTQPSAAAPVSNVDYSNGPGTPNQGTSKDGYFVSPIIPAAKPEREAKHPKQPNDDYHVAPSEPKKPDNGYHVTPAKPAQDRRHYNPPGGGYHVTPPQRNYPTERHYRQRDNFSVSITLPTEGEVQYPAVAIHSGAAQSWVKVRPGFPLPPNAVLAGFETRPYSKLYVCRAFYSGGIHPGKLVDNSTCRIGWGGDEISLFKYEVLVSFAPLQWKETYNGYLPRNAMQGGHQFDGPLFICRGNYRGNRLVGKVYKGACHVAWKGKEVLLRNYSVLSR